MLSNGKKFDPCAIEEAFKEFDLVSDAFVFGNNRAFPGVLLFLADEKIDDWLRIKALVEKVNERSHWRIIEEMAIVMDAGMKLQKNSKGAVMRGVAEDLFRESIDQAYDKFECRGMGEKIDIADVHAVRRFVYSIVKDVTGKMGIKGDTDLFTAGVDSVMASQIRNRLVKVID